jgi:hypothetical protein
MLRLILVFLTLYCGSAATAPAADPLHEVRKSFAIGGKPIPAEIFADFGEAWMSDKRPIVVTIDAKAAIDSNRYADPIKRTAAGAPAGSTTPRRWHTNIAAQPPAACWCSWPPQSLRNSLGRRRSMDEQKERSVSEKWIPGLHVFPWEGPESAP